MKTFKEEDEEGLGIITKLLVVKKKWSLTDQPTNQPTNQPTDQLINKQTKPLRDAWTHLKT